MEATGREQVSAAAGVATGEPVRALIGAAAARFAPAGVFARKFAYWKLRTDPVFLELLRRGLIPDGARLLDLGCGQGLLLALLVAAREQHRAGAWPAGWPPPPASFSLRGIDVAPANVRRARIALGREAEIEELDLQHARLAAADVIVILDVLHYLPPEAQDRLLTSVAEALAPKGLLLARVGNPRAGISSAVTWAVDQVVRLGRSGRLHRLYRREVPQWVAALERLGFTVGAEPMNQGPPFANVLLVARKR
jgi:SAM-dependent methyltransferase